MMQIGDNQRRSADRVPPVSTTIKELKIAAESALSEFVRDVIPKIFSEIFSSPPNLKLSSSQGFAGVAFVITSEDNQYFLKVEQSTDVQGGRLAREASLVEIAIEGGATRSVSGLGGVRSVEATLLPPSFANLQFPRGSDPNPKPLNSGNLDFSLAPLITAPDAAESITDQALQLTFARELGREVAAINSVVVTGFGLDYDVKSKSFAIPTYTEYFTHGIIKNLKTGAGLAPHECWTELKGKIEFSEIESLKIAASLTRLPLYDLDSRLTHGDLNPKNYKGNERGELVALLDFGQAGGRPWEHELAKALIQFTTTAYGIPENESQQRAIAFTEGYENIHGPIDATQMEMIKDFYTLELIACLHIFCVQFGKPTTTTVPLLEQAVIHSSTRPPNEPDYSLVASKAARELNRLIRTENIWGTS